MSRKNILRIIAIIVVAVVAVGVFIAQMTTPKAAEPSVEQKNGYSTITSVAGCTFMVNSVFTDQATAVTQISDGIDFDRQGFYSYKNGTDQYMLFQLDGIVVAVEKGTTFNFDDYKDKEEALNNSSIMGIWFGTDKDGIKYDKKDYRGEGIVTAQVVITNDLYNDFIGKLVCLKKDGEEWSMFVGIPGTRYKEVGKEAKNGIESIAESFHLSDNTGEFAEPEYAVVISGDNVGQVVKAEEIEVKKEKPPKQTVSEPAAPVEESEKVSADSVSEQEEPVEEVVVQEEKPTEAPIEEKDEEEKKPETAAAKPTVTVKSTVRNNASDDKAYSSSIYSMLSVGKSGVFEAKTGTGDGITQMIVKLNAIQDSKVTSNEVYNYVLKHMNDTILYEAPPGCHFESAEFEVSAPEGASSIPYTDVRFVGADGKALKFRGIKYSTRTYDLISEDDMSGGKRIVYYAVPNGCTEYVLKFGDGDDINGWKSAYYYVER